MYKRILIPTDGSRTARKAIKAGVAIAKTLGADVVGYHAAEPLERLYYAQGAGVRSSDIAKIEKRLRELGEKYLVEIVDAATALDVRCETVLTTPGAAYQGIVATARKKKCDMIFMASHGRGTLASIMLGSVTHKVLTNSKIPVLVFR